MLNRFSETGSRGDAGTAIPREKHSYFKDNDDFTPVFDLHLDLPGYEIPPHPDNPNKIVTFLFYMSKDRTLAPYGTNMCVPKPGVTPRKPEVSLFERLLRPIAGRFRPGSAQANGTVGKTSISSRPRKRYPTRCSLSRQNEISFHAVRVNAPKSLKSRGRPIIRGFIRTGGDKVPIYLADYKTRPRPQSCVGPGQSIQPFR